MSLTAIGGVPLRRWSEDDGTNYELRVSRLNAAGTAWQEVVGGPSPINHAGNRNATDPSLTAIGGVPYVASSTRTTAPTTSLRPDRERHGAGIGAGHEQPPRSDRADNRNARAASLTAIGRLPTSTWGGGRRHRHLRGAAAR